MSRARLGGATIAAAVNTLAIQVTALVSLGAAQFGLFSIVYLVGALALSELLSIVSEAWARSDLQGVGSSWREYASATFYFGAFAGIVSGLVAILLPDTPPSAGLFAAIAVLASVYRSGARFYSMRLSDWPGVLRGDLAAAAVAVGSAVWVIVLARGSLVSVMISWAATALAGALFSRLCSPLPPTALLTWVRRHRSVIRALLGDSLVLDAAAIGTPYVLAPILGVANFGVYRAVSNVAAPVRLLLSAIRPRLAGNHARAAFSLSRMMLIVVSSAVTGFLASVCLALVEDLHLQLGALLNLAQYNVPVGIFVGANLFGTYFMIIARSTLRAKSLYLGRGIHTTIAIVMPVAFGIILGLPGAIWAYTCSTIVWASVWLWLVRRASALQD